MSNSTSPPANCPNLSNVHFVQGEIRLLGVIPTETAETGESNCKTFSLSLQFPPSQLQQLQCNPAIASAAKISAENSCSVNSNSKGGESDDPTNKASSSPLSQAQSQQISKQPSGIASQQQSVLISRQQSEVVSQQKSEVISQQQSEVVSQHQSEVVSQQQLDLASQQQPEVVISRQQSQPIPQQESSEQSEQPYGNSETSPDYPQTTQQGDANPIEGSYPESGVGAQNNTSSGPQSSPNNASYNTSSGSSGPMPCPKLTMSMLNAQNNTGTLSSVEYSARRDRQPSSNMNSRNTTFNSPGQMQSSNIGGNAPYQPVIVNNMVGRLNNTYDSLFDSTRSGGGANNTYDSMFDSTRSGGGANNTYNSMPDSSRSGGQPMNSSGFTPNSSSSGSGPQSSPNTGSCSTSYNTSGPTQSSFGQGNVSAQNNTGTLSSMEYSARSGGLPNPYMNSQNPSFNSTGPLQSSNVGNAPYQPLIVRNNVGQPNNTSGFTPNSFSSGSSPQSSPNTGSCSTSYNTSGPTQSSFEQGNVSAQNNTSNLSNVDYTPRSAGEPRSFVDSLNPSFNSTGPLQSSNVGNAPYQPLIVRNNVGVTNNTSGSTSSSGNPGVPNNTYASMFDSSRSGGQPMNSSGFTPNSSSSGSSPQSSPNTGSCSTSYNTSGPTQSSFGQGNVSAQNNTGTLSNVDYTPRSAGEPRSFVDSQNPSFNSTGPLQSSNVGNAPYQPLIVKNNVMQTPNAQGNANILNNTYIVPTPSGFTTPSTSGGPGSTQTPNAQGNANIQNNTYIVPTPSGFTTPSKSGGSGSMQSPNLQGLQNYGYFVPNQTGPTTGSCGTSYNTSGPTQSSIGQGNVSAQNNTGTLSSVDYTPRSAGEPRSFMDSQNTSFNSRGQMESSSVGNAPYQPLIVKNNVMQTPNAQGNAGGQNNTYTVPTPSGFTTPSKSGTQSSPNTFNSSFGGSGPTPSPNAQGNVAAQNNTYTVPTPIGFTSNSSSSGSGPQNNTYNVTPNSTQGPLASYLDPDPLNSTAIEGFQGRPKSPGLSPIASYAAEPNDANKTYNISGSSGGGANNTYNVSGSNGGANNTYNVSGSNGGANNTFSVPESNGRANYTFSVSGSSCGANNTYSQPGSGGGANNTYNVSGSNGGANNTFSVPGSNGGANNTYNVSGSNGAANNTYNVSGSSDDPNKTYSVLGNSIPGNTTWNTSGSSNGANSQDVTPYANRVFDIEKLKTWVQQSLDYRCPGTCEGGGNANSPCDCKECTLKNMMMLLTHWRALYVKKS